MIKKTMKYMEKYPMYNSLVHAVGGIGVGVLIARDVAGEHPVRFGLVLITLALLGHLYPMTLKRVK
jgi:hypothetical protein